MHDHMQKKKKKKTSKKAIKTLMITFPFTSERALIRRENFYAFKM